MTSLCAAVCDAIEGGDIAVIELEPGRSHVLLEVRDRARAGDQEHAVVAGQQPGESNLGRRCRVLVGNPDDCGDSGQPSRAACDAETSRVRGIQFR